MCIRDSHVFFFDPEGKVAVIDLCHGFVNLMRDTLFQVVAPGEIVFVFLVGEGEMCIRDSA